MAGEPPGRDGKYEASQGQAAVQLALHLSSSLIFHSNSSKSMSALVASAI